MKQQEEPDNDSDLVVKSVEADVIIEWIFEKNVEFMRKLGKEFCWRGHEK